jgi:hypothetical protein
MLSGALEAELECRKQAWWRADGRAASSPKLRQDGDEGEGPFGSVIDDYGFAVASRARRPCRHVAISAARPAVELALVLTLALELEGDDEGRPVFACTLDAQDSRTAAQQHSSTAGVAVRMDASSPWPRPRVRGRKHRSWCGVSSGLAVALPSKHARAVCVCVGGWGEAGRRGTVDGRRKV